MLNANQPPLWVRWVRLGVVGFILASWLVSLQRIIYFGWLDDNGCYRSIAIQDGSFRFGGKPWCDAPVDASGLHFPRSATMTPA